MMRDEMDARIWNDHHADLSLSLEPLLASIHRLGLSLFPSGTPCQLLVAMAALGLSLISLGGTVA